MGLGIAATQGSDADVRRSLEPDFPRFATLPPALQSEYDLSRPPSKLASRQLSRRHSSVMVWLGARPRRRSLSGLATEGEGTGRSSVRPSVITCRECND